MQLSSLLAALKFVKFGQYVNTARVDAKLLCCDNQRLKNSDSKTLTIGIMTGTTTESFLFTAVEGGPRHNPWTEHRITLAPFTQDMRRDVSMWGLVLNFHVIGGLANSLGFSFTTRAEGKGDGAYGKHKLLLSKFHVDHLDSIAGPAASSTSASNSTTLMAVSSPLLARSGTSGYTASKGFNDAG